MWERIHAGAAMVALAWMATACALWTPTTVKVNGKEYRSIDATDAEPLSSGIKRKLGVTDRGLRFRDNTGYTKQMEPDDIHWPDNIRMKIFAGEGRRINIDQLYAIQGKVKEVGELVAELELQGKDNAYVVVESVTSRDKIKRYLNSASNTPLRQEMAGTPRWRVVTTVLRAYDQEKWNEVRAELEGSVDAAALEGIGEFEFTYKTVREELRTLDDGTIVGYEYDRICWSSPTGGEVKMLQPDPEGSDPVVESGSICYVGHPLDGTR